MIASRYSVLTTSSKINFEETFSLTNRKEVKMSHDLEMERIEICRSIGQRIKTIRKQRHLTLGDIAVKVGFSRS